MPSSERKTGVTEAVYYPPRASRIQRGHANEYLEADRASAAGPRQGVKSVQIKISARHGHLSEETQQFIHEKAQKLLHFFNRLTMIEATVDLQADPKVVELVVQAEHKHDFVARETHPELLVAIDRAVDKMEGQLRRYKEKIQDHRRNPSTGEAAAAPSREEPNEE